MVINRRKNIFLSARNLLEGSPEFFPQPTSPSAKIVTRGYLIYAIPNLEAIKVDRENLRINHTFNFFNT